MEPELLPDYLNLKGNFQEQVKNITQNVRLTRQEVDNLNLLYVHLEGALQSGWPGCKVVPFGSIVTGLGIKTSDVDCFVDLPGGSYNDNYVIKARNLLRRQPWLFQNLFAITTAKVPILKFFHIPTHRQCDINFKSPAGQRKILPSIYKLQQYNESFIVDGWNTAFSEDFSFMTDNSESLYELLGGFFKFYSTVNFDQDIISPFTGNFIPRKVFQNLEDVPSEFDMYKMNVGSNEFDSLRIDTKICVQDPFEHNRNCTLSVFPRLAATLIAHFKLAAQLYEENSIDFYLIDILARKPSQIPPTKHKNKGNQKKNNKPERSIHVPIQNGKIMKPKQKPKKKLHNNLELLYRNSLKIERNKKR
ncbi:hypothetical protein evm_008570 [Chilo suppressalis]|nr:hypothetical protein evm_008570 [Chilo suppressalis]